MQWLVPWLGMMVPAEYAVPTLHGYGGGAF